MKKILLIIILCFPIGIYAWTDEYFEDKKVLASQEKFLWYEEIRVNEEYGLLNSLSKTLDDYDFIFTEYTEYQKEYPDEISDRVIESKIDELIFTDEDINGVYLSGFNLDKALKIYRIEVYYKGLPSSYNNISVTVSINGNLSSDLELDDEKYIEVNKDTVIKLNFSLDIDFKQIVLILYYDLDEKITFNQTFFNNEYDIAKKTFTSNELKVCNSCNQMLAYGLEWQWQINYTFFESTFRYKDKLYLYYDLERKYLEGYHVYKEGYIKDEASVKVFYKYADRVINSDVKENISSKDEINLTTQPIELPEENIEDIEIEKEYEVYNIYKNDTSYVPIKKENKFKMNHYLNIVLSVFMFLLVLVNFFVKKSRVKY